MRRIRGEVEAIEGALEAKVGCADVLLIIASIRGAVNGLTVEVIKNHIPCYVSAPSLRTKERAGAADDLIEVVRPYPK